MQKVLEVLEEEFSVCKLASAAGVDFSAPLFFFAKTDRELSLVCPASAAPAAAAREEGWRGVRVAGQLDFSLVGVLAELTSHLAGAGIGLFALSTFDTDYLFVRQANFARAIAVLAAAGWRIQSPPAADDFS